MIRSNHIVSSQPVAVAVAVTACKPKSVPLNTVALPNKRLFSSPDDQIAATKDAGCFDVAAEVGGSHLTPHDAAWPPKTDRPEAGDNWDV